MVSCTEWAEKCPDEIVHVWLINKKKFETLKISVWV